MDLKNDKIKLDIKRKLISKDLNELLKLLIVFILLSILFGYIGYIYSKDNNISISHGIIFGILFPLGVGLLEILNFDSFFSFIIYTIIYLAITSYIPTFIGGIILFIIIGIFIIDFIYIEKQDRTKEIEEYCNYNKFNKEKNQGTVQNNKSNTVDRIIEYCTAKSDEKLIDNKDMHNENDEEFECEMCFKKISKEEYEFYDCMCEECFMDVHTDKDGNFHDDEYFE